MSTYCEIAPGHPFHGPYHDTQYGFPLQDDNELFGRLLLEINQAGLSWLTILKKQESMRAAYSGFSVAAVAAYDDADRERLRADPGVIRNRLKINAAIHNAGRILQLQDEFGSFANWLDSHHPLAKDEWVKLFKKHFRFTGGEIVGEFLMSTGYLPGAHEESCPVFQEILALNPPWLQSQTSASSTLRIRIISSSSTRKSRLDDALDKTADPGKGQFMQVRVRQITIISSNMIRSQQFYRDQLKLVARYESPDWSEYDAGTVVIAVHPGPPAGSRETPQMGTDAGTANIVLTVSNLAQFCEQLQDGGIDVNGPFELEGLPPIATFEDPDGISYSVQEDNA